MDTLSLDAPMPDLSLDDFLATTTSPQHASGRTSTSSSQDKDPLGLDDSDMLNTLRNKNPERPVEEEEMEQLQSEAPEEFYLSQGSLEETEEETDDRESLETLEEEEENETMIRTRNSESQGRTQTLSTVTLKPHTLGATTKASLGGGVRGPIGSGRSSTGPIILNGKNILPKTAMPMQYIKLPLKPGAGATAASSGTTTTTARAAPQITTINGRKAIRTPAGQIIFIRKAPASSGSASTASTPLGAPMKASDTGNASSTTSISGKLLTSSSKTVMVRSADGKLLPLKAATATTTTSAGVVGGGGITKQASLALPSDVAAQLSIGKKVVTATSAVKGVGGGGSSSSDSGVGKVVFKRSTGEIVASTPLGGGGAETMTTTSTGKNIKALIAGAAGSASSKATTLPSAVTQKLGSMRLTPTTTPQGTIIMKAVPQTQQSTATSAASTTTTTSTKAIGGTATGATSGGTGKILVQMPGGKKIFVSNQFLKLPSKTQGGAGTGAAGGVASGASGSMQKFITISGKSGYVKVVNSNASGGERTDSAKTTLSTSSGAKILNASVGGVSGGVATTTQKLPVMPTTTKFVLTPSPKSSSSTESGGGGQKTTNFTFSPMTTKVQKTVVSVPSTSVRTLNIEAPGTSSGGSGSIRKTLGGSMSQLQVLPKKIKIANLNTEIQRMTASGDDDDVDLDHHEQKPQPRKLPTATTAVIRKGPTGGSTGGGNQRVFFMTRKVLKSDGTMARIVTTSSGVQGTSLSSNQAVAKKYYSLLKGGAIHQQPKSDAKLTPIEKSKLICNQAQMALKQKQQLEYKRMIIKKDANEEVCQAVVEEEPSDTPATECKATIAKVKDEPLEEAPKPATVDDAASMIAGVRRKHCNCSKSQCLKLYCDCFANGEFCQDCTCKDCCNNLQFEDERQKAIKTCLERNPSAFKPKITTARDMGDMRLHNKGCNCKRSGCLKNYCECYEAKIPCSSNCKCVGCRNIEERVDLDMDPSDPKFLANLASTQGTKRAYDAFSTVRAEKLKSIKTDDHAVSDPLQIEDDDDYVNGRPIEKQPHNFITQEVIDATIQCMISQAVECDKNGLSETQTERKVMEELGACLVEIIDFSIHNANASATQD